LLANWHAGKLALRQNGIAGIFSFYLLLFTLFFTMDFFCGIIFMTVWKFIFLLGEKS